MMEDWRLMLMVDQPTGLALSSAMWGVSRPPEIQHDTDATQLMFSVIKHPTLDEYGMELLTTAEFYVHPDCDIYTFDAFLAPHIPLGNVTEQEKIALQNAINNAKGGKLTVWPSLPAYFRAASLDFDAAYAAGWFGEESA